MRRRGDFRVIRDPRHAALRQLRDCGVIRTRFEHVGLIGLYEEGLVDADPVADDDEAVDFRLNVHGRAAVREAFGE
jgi:hypothetical protein